MWLHGLILIVTAVAAQTADVEVPNIEAAFQGRCGHGSPCEQLCYELHDGMYECDCTEGYELNKNGYSCQEINSTFQSGEQDNQQVEEDILYQRGASFSAKLDDSNTHSPSGGGISSSSSSSSNSNISKSSNISNNNNYNNATTNDEVKINSSGSKIVVISDKLSSGIGSQPNALNGHTKYTNVGLKSGDNNSRRSKLSYTKSIEQSQSATSDPKQPAPTSIDGLYSKEDVTTYDESISGVRKHSDTLKSRVAQSAPSIVGAKILINDKTQSVLNGFKPTTTAATKGVVVGAANTTDDGSTKATGSSCTLDCGLDGLCDSVDDMPVCLCPYGKIGQLCNEDVKISTPKFSKKSWLAFPALKGAYKHVQIHIEFRPESFDGIILLTGERDDLTGDFIALLIYQGFIEFWFDCGSGTGKVKSEETVVLNQWNTITIFRHRWDAWLILNQGNRIQGRSKGLFSRITFREPVFLGGTGNITGLAKKLPTTDGMVGCIRKFIANEHEYKFDSTPYGDVTQGFDIQECSTDRCSHVPCQHGGKCLPADQGAICLCPLGFGGDLCEMRLDLQVPSFNGSSYLRYAPLGDTAIIWFELRIILKPQQEDGLLVYSGHHEYGDYISLSLNMGFVEFTFDLGSGAATVRSEMPLTMGQWHTIKVSRTARLAVLKIDQLPEVMTISPNGFWHLSLPHSLFLGGVHNMQTLPIRLREKGSFVGCIQKIEINNHQIAIIAEALGGSNVDNCPHACVARPCGPLATCVPHLESYECQCNPFNAQCNQAEEISSDELLVKGSSGATLTSTDTSSKSSADDADLVTEDDNDSYYYDYDEVDNDDDNNDKLKSGNNYSNDGNNVKTDKNQVDEKTIKPSGDFIEQTTAVVRNKQQQRQQQQQHQHQQWHNDDNNGKTPPSAAQASGIRERFMTSNDDVNTDKLKAEEKRAKQLSKGYSSSSSTASSPFGVKKTSNKSNSKSLLNKQRQNDEVSTNTDPNDYDNKLVLNYDNVVIEDDERRRRTKEGLDVGVPVQRKQHKMRYRPEDDMVIDEVFIDGLDDDSGGVKRIMPNQRKYHGACFTGTDSYFHYNDVDTMKTIISYRIDLNLRFRTHSANGLILWTGRHSAFEDDDFLSLGVEKGYLHLRYNLGSGDVNIKYNSTKVSDGLWHRIRAMRNSQEGTLKVDGGKPIIQRSPGKLRQLNTDTGLYVGGMPNTPFYTRQRYINGISGCISEIVLASELRLNLDAKTLGTAHNVEPGAP